MVMNNQFKLFGKMIKNRNESVTANRKILRQKEEQFPFVSVR
jgi:hypothetical protein